jgi:dTDP-4-dehydrorhamnose 3,5-epimerase
MILHDTSLADARLIELQPRGDERGWFARTMSRTEFEQAGLNADFRQQNTSVSANAGTLRGMHFQLGPHTEAKLVRCIRGAIVDIIVDLRLGSPSYLKHEKFELTPSNNRILYVPEGFAHAFQTLTEDTEVTYLVTADYTPEAERGVRYSDPRLGIDWPLEVTTISPKDAAWPLLGEGDPGFFRYQGAGSTATR